MSKKFSIAFIWHMHQPNYKDKDTGDYLMPWVRLHAIKDYLDMLLILEKFPKIKQTFNIVPLLIDQLNDYSVNNAHDAHSRLTVSKIEDLSNEDKKFVLDHFFDANFANMIESHDVYRSLYEKRYQNKEIFIDDFSPQDFSDIMAWFNLAWFDPYWVENNPELTKLYLKGSNFTLEDRRQIIQIQREIIAEIIPAYKKFWDEGKIEIATSPYYHPIMPLLLDFESAKVSNPNTTLPHSKSGYVDDARYQVLKSIEKFQDVFGKKPVGLWPSEHCISDEVLDLISEFDFKWTITDEGVLSKTIGKEFVRNFRGQMEDPFDLCQSYKYTADNKDISLLFRNSALANLIGFEYGNHEPSAAANDLYERIKTIQAKLQNSPDKNHIITIALDGENCWESYKFDGRPFLLELYKLLSEDDSLDVTTVSEYLSTVEHVRKLDSVHSGSWINRNFNIWIGDPTKNLAWDYISKTREDLIKITAEGQYDEQTIAKAWKEIYIAEGSDWFWWYGEPNDSGHDHLFDKLFREHLQKIYNLLGKDIPQYLTVPLESFIGKPSKNPKDIFTPKINGVVDSEEEWMNAGCIEIPHGPMYQSDKLFDRVFFGNDKDKMYFRFDASNIHLEDAKQDVHCSEIYIYFHANKHKATSPMRIKNRSESIPEVLKYLYTHELEVQVCRGEVLFSNLSVSMENLLWKVDLNHNTEISSGKVVELAIPFDDIGIDRGKEVHLVIAMTKCHLLDEIIPQNQALVIRRPE